jgi:UDP-3-O-[3-hydroxymyristoyl] N-acetylglucosamine deacetylase
LGLSSICQHTLARPASFGGIGVHSGRSVDVTVRPAAPGSGIRFVRTDIAQSTRIVEATVSAVCDTRLSTTIGNTGGVMVSTVEHLMAVFCGLAIDNAIVEIDGPEAPIMDGSCQPFVRAIDRGGRMAQPAARRYIEILAPVEVRDGDKRATLTPSDRFEVAFEIDFEAAAIGRQSVDLAIDEVSFRRELADCRTFGFLHEVEALRAVGLARGGGLDNAVVFEEGRVLNPEGLRRPDECVRHKVLDAIGDLYLLGAPILGRYEGLYAGHTLNNALARALLARPDAWRDASLCEDLAVAV